MLLSFSHPSPTEVRAETAVADSLIPSLILADEPISALDPIVAVQIVNELKSLREKYNTAIILVTHNIKIAKSITDNILVLNNGKTLDYGNTKEVLSSSKSDFTKELILSTLG